LKTEGAEGFICCFDPEFPTIQLSIKGSERPFLLFYKGDISLLSSVYNVAVIGVIDPTEEIAKREERVVDFIVKSKFNVVSGLAKGCDSIAHRYCVENGGKTIAILPTNIGNIYPAENRDLAQRIVETGGLLIAEYYEDADNRYKAISRFVERDRLQAMFSNAVILIASYRNGEGDSGSRHAIEKAKKYGKKRFVMYNETIDQDDIQFGLNKDLLNNEKDVLLLTLNSLNDFLIDKSFVDSNDSNYQQMKLF
jgi:DNA processing protein